MSDFATDPKFIRQGYQEVIRGVKFGWNDGDALLKSYTTAHRSGDPRKEIQAIAGKLKGKPWSWPDLERAATEFQPLGVWPVVWTELEISAPLHWDHVPDKARFELLNQTLASAIYRVRDMAGWLTVIKDGVGSLRLRVSDDRCEASKVMQARYGDRIAAGDYRTLPPYFPGDTCQLRWSLRPE